MNILTVETCLLTLKINRKIDKLDYNRFVTGISNLCEQKLSTTHREPCLQDKEM